MDKELGEEELYALARGVVGERCALLEAAFRTDPGGLLAYSDDPLARAMEKEAGKDVPMLTEREHVGMLALASLERLFKVRRQPWLDPYSTTPPEMRAERCARHVRGLLRYLEPNHAEMAWRFADAPEALMAQQDQQKPQQDQPAATEPQHHQDAAPAVAQSMGTRPSLSDDQKAEVVRRYDRGRGESVRSMAIEFGVSRNVIDRALRAAGIKK
ncbi:hypothetical protein [Hydrogenophaga pseudoflava]|uniref:Uncharacterized protein n=1 Tax=Hydrogenophaga pseudoflava TaxID=47421 RepID=A0A4P6WZV6_HYDPS|nr:hypothetical protein [Hydrogenophaga pseudoflava]QBM27965.1 hypothetical protein HPF_09730 [Hydrogenophaga pseudoflava]